VSGSLGIRLLTFKRRALVHMLRTSQSWTIRQLLHFRKFSMTAVHSLRKHLRPLDAGYPLRHRTVREQAGIARPVTMSHICDEHEKL
jgi:hypothetical protein